MYQFPLHLECDLLEFNVASDLKIKRMDVETREKLFWIKNLKKTEAGYSFNPLHGYQEINAGFLTSFLLTEQLSNYILLTEDSSRANELNFALKLIENSSTTLYTGFGASSSCSYVSLCSYDQKLPPQKITQREVELLQKLVSQIHNSCREDKKFQILMDTYIHAMFHGIRSASRFIEFSIILEMLLLPERINNDIAKNFRNRLAKFMAKHFDYPEKEVRDHGLQIYDTRSNIVHSGEDKDAKFESTTEIAHEYIRNLLIKYLEDKSLFSNNEMNALGRD